jgi:hypothetical protein
MLGNSFFIDTDLLGAVSDTGELLFMTQDSIQLAYLNCYDMTSFHYDEYNCILWVGNSLGEVIGYSIARLSASSPPKDKKDKPRPGSSQQAFFQDANDIGLSSLSEKTDLDLLKYLSYIFTGSYGFLSLKTFYNLFFETHKTLSLMVSIKQKAEKVINKPELRVTKKFQFQTEGRRIVNIKSSFLSNVLIAVDIRSRVTIWDIHSNELLLMIYPNHFVQSNLFDLLEDSTGDYKSFLHKDFVAIQKPVAVDISEQNEDFAIISDDYLSLYSVSGSPIAQLRRAREARFTCVHLCNVLISHPEYLQVRGPLRVHRARGRIAVLVHSGREEPGQGFQT